VAWEVKERDTQTGNVRGLGGQRKGHANRECTWPDFGVQRGDQRKML